MYANLRSVLVVLPLLVGPILGMAAQPLVLDTANMDRITAGSRPLFERIAGVLDALPRGSDDADTSLFVRLNADQQALLTGALEGEQIAFQQTRPGELAATHQLASGEKLVLVKQVAPSVGTAAPALLRQVEQATARLAAPGETLNVRQGSGNGFNYLYIRSIGNSAVTVTQRNGF
jgi:hypothetical protein